MDLIAEIVEMHGMEPVLKALMDMHLKRVGEFNDRMPEWARMAHRMEARYRMARRQITKK